MTYQELVAARKNSTSEYPGFINQIKIENGKFDQGDFLDPWAKWYNKVPADILLVGQDWGSEEYFIKNNGYDDDNNPTCLNLTRLFLKAGITIGKPSKPNSDISIHFANVIPFLRTGKMQGGGIITKKILTESVDNFLRPLVEIVRPRLIITLGTIPFRSVLSVFKETEYEHSKLKTLIDKHPIMLGNQINVFPMFHCGAMGINFNRNFSLQEADWSKLKKYF